MVNEVRNPGFEDNAIWATYQGHGGVVDRHPIHASASIAVENDMGIGSQSEKSASLFIRFLQLEDHSPGDIDGQALVLDEDG